MTYAPPYLPHEVDAHPDGARIRATLEDATRPLEESVEALEEQLAEARDDAEEWMTRSDGWQADADQAAKDRDDERNRRVALSNAAEWLLIGLIKGDKRKVRKGLADLAACGVAEEFLTTVDAAEIEGHAEFLTGEETQA